MGEQVNPAKSRCYQRNAGKLEGLRVYPPPSPNVSPHLTDGERVYSPLFLPMYPHTLFLHHRERKVQRVWNFTEPFVHMWQSCVEVKDYSVAYFDHITALEASYCWTSVKGGAYIHLVNLFIYKACMSPGLNGSSVVWCFEHGNTIKIIEGIIFDCYTGLPHIHLNFIKVW